MDSNLLIDDGHRAKLIDKIPWLADVSQNSNYSNVELLSTMKYDPSLIRMTRKGEYEWAFPITKLSTFKYLDENEFQTQVYSWLEDTQQVTTTTYHDDIKKAIEELVTSGKTFEINDDDNSLYYLYYFRFLLLGEQFVRLKLAASIFRRNFHLTLREFINNLVNAIYLDIYSNEQIPNDPIDKLKRLLDDNRTYKMRVLLKGDNSLEFQAHHLGVSDNGPTAEKLLFGEILTFNTAAGSDDLWDVIVDSEPTPCSILTSLKTTSRDHYASARRRMEHARTWLDISGKTEVLIWNDKEEIMEGSITNIAILNKDGELVTPPLSSGCLCGTMRYYLMRKKLIKADTIEKNSLYENQLILIFNDVMGVIKGRIRFMPKV